MRGAFTPFQRTVIGVALLLIAARLLFPVLTISVQGVTLATSYIPGVWGGQRPGYAAHAAVGITLLHVLALAVLAASLCVLFPNATVGARSKRTITEGARKRSIATTMRLKQNGKDRAINERGISTIVKSDEGKKYLVGTTRAVDGGWITGVSKTRMFGFPGERMWVITTAESEREAMEIHFAVEEVVQKQYPDSWESSLAAERLVARKILNEAERRGL